MIEPPYLLENPRRVTVNGTSQPGRGQAPHVLMICTANICRSPVAEAVLRQRLQQRGLENWQVSSAGTWADRGRSATTFSTQLLAAQAIDLTSHRSRLVTAELLAEVDLVLCMASGHAEALRAEFPDYASKVFLLSEMSGRSYSISDPYGGPLEEYRRMVQDVTAAIDAGLPRIIEWVTRKQAH